MKIKWLGMSAFLITSDKGTRIITDPYATDINVLYSEIKESADVVTISCGQLSHCYVFAVSGLPYIYKGPEPLEIKSIKFNCVMTNHLAMEEIKHIDPGPNGIICFEVDGIRLCHLGALGHRLSEQQVAQVGKVDILFVPVGGHSTMPVEVATKVCWQLTPKVIFPMHYKSDKCIFPNWAGVDEFLHGKENVTRMDSNINSSELEYRVDTIPTQTRIIVPGSAY
jgi:L-ascorbate metabolism protein UlaG (beta-lactamase superfamily)